MGKKNIYALKYRILNKFYDPVVSYTCKDDEVKSKITETLFLENGNKVLDIGCGTGSLLLKIKEQFPSIEAFGIDADNQILEIARKKSNDANTAIKFVVGLAEKLPFEDQKFDVVVSSLFFHHLTSKDKKVALKDIYRVMNEKGRLIISDWDYPNNILSKIGFMGVRILDGFENTKLHADGKFNELFYNAGFSNVQTYEKINTIFGTITIWIVNK